ncbi:MAG: SLBB domain-containing protein [Ignavibacteriaceae bacterium]|nr:SLBB domain-containing protein [Ignavibacteriaceae bacterium]
MDFATKIREAGVVGAGGGGFPTHIKAGSKVEFVLANGAECEPLLHKDYELMLAKPEEIVNGMKLMMSNTGSSKGYFGIKTKNAKAIEVIGNHISNSNISITELGDFYPSGDEYELVYEATGRLIPPAGIPLQVGCLVNNVETFLNVLNANQGKPVTEKFICVAGAVKNPSTFFVPVGITVKEAIELAGGASVQDYAVFVSGIMMGKLTFDFDEVVTKTTAGFIILPSNHYLVNRTKQPEKNKHRIGKSACDQCTFCTEFCPRYLLGYNVQPHQVMRSLGFTKTGSSVWNQMAELCCACGLCTLYSCPEDLFPKEACDKAKVEMRAEGIKYVQTKEVKVHPMKKGRKVPLKQLMRKLKVLDYDAHTPYKEFNYEPASVKIMLKQNAGEKSEPVVKATQFVKKGDVVAVAPKDKLGTNQHASIDGIISDVTENFIRIVRK